MWAFPSPSRIINLIFSLNLAGRRSHLASIVCSIKRDRLGVQYPQEYMLYHFPQLLH
jgi:hypothetical protein